MMDKTWNQRKKSILLVSIVCLGLLLILIAGRICTKAAVSSDFSQTNLVPCLKHPFGTDWLGRDMLARTLRGLSTSIWIGIVTAAVSAVLALILGVAAAVFGTWVDVVISFLIDLVMGIPHILLLILISLALGRGLTGVMAGIMLTHWPSLARVVRGEMLQLREMPYILAAGKLGKSKLYIAVRHMAPNVMPQFLTGMVLLFPHAVLHESSVTFLGFGLSSNQPAIGIILSESMKYLIMGNWWLALFPGIMLATIVLLFHYVGESIRSLTDPAGAHR